MYRFLWAALQLDLVCQQVTDRDIKLALNDLPMGLNETYERCIKRIELLGPRRASRCRLFLHWIIGSRYSTLPELAVIIGVSEMTVGHWDEKCIVNCPQSLIDDCAGLCSLEHSDEVNLIHASVSDFLCSSDCLHNFQFHEVDFSLAALELQTKFSAMPISDEHHVCKNPMADPPNVVLMANPDWIWHYTSIALAPLVSPSEMHRLLIVFQRSSQQTLSALSRTPKDTVYEHQFCRFSSHLFGIVAYLDVWLVTTELFYGYLEFAQMLVDRGHAIDTANEGGFCPLHIVVASDSMNRVDVCSLLVSRGANVNAVGASGKTALRLVCDRQASKEDIALLQLFLKNGANPTLADHSGYTPLHAAVKNLNSGACSLLLSYGADSRATDVLGITPLHLCFSLGVGRLQDKYCYPVLKNLLRHGAYVSASDNFGRTPLHSVVDLCLVNKGWQMPLGVAALINNGANTGAKDCFGATALHLACDIRSRCYFSERSLKQFYWDSQTSYDTLETLHLLSNDRNAFKVVDDMGRTPLHVYSKNQVTEEPSYLSTYMFIFLSNPSALQARDNFGRCPDAQQPHRVRNAVWRFASLKAAYTASNAKPSPARWTFEVVDTQSRKRSRFMHEQGRTMRNTKPFAPTALCSTELGVRKIEIPKIKLRRRSQSIPPGFMFTPSTSQNTRYANVQKITVSSYSQHPWLVGMRAGWTVDMCSRKCKHTLTSNCNFSTT